MKKILFVFLFVEFICQTTVLCMLSNFVVINSSPYVIGHDDIWISYDNVSFEPWARVGITIIGNSAECMGKRNPTDTIKKVRIWDFLVGNYVEVHGFTDGNLSTGQFVIARAFKTDESGIYRIDIVTYRESYINLKFVIVNHTTFPLEHIITGYSDCRNPASGLIFPMQSSCCSTFTVNTRVEYDGTLCGCTVNQRIPQTSYSNITHRDIATSEPYYSGGVIGVEMTNSKTEQESKPVE